MVSIYGVIKKDLYKQDALRLYISGLRNRRSLLDSINKNIDIRNVAI
jgi:hypothetical protein